MLYKTVLSLFETDHGLDFELLENLLDKSPKLINSICDLGDRDLEIFFKLLIDSKQFGSLTKVIKALDSAKQDYNPSLVILALFKQGKLRSLEDLKKAGPLLKRINEQNALPLIPVADRFPEHIQKKIERSLMRRHSDVLEFKDELKEQIEFLKAQMLSKKALEIEAKLKFHFPEVKEQFLSAKETQSKNEEQKHSKIIDRNLKMNRSSSRKPMEPSRQAKHSAEDQKEGLKLAKLWLSEMQSKNTELFLTQMEFLNVENIDFYSEVLEKSNNLDIWTKSILYIKSQKFLEGLDFIEKHERDLLTESPESIYNYYYTKGLLLLGAGMNKEAEEIFTTIKEQKGNFRDILMLLQNAK